MTQPPDPGRPALHDLGRRLGTNKWNQHHTFRGESYLHVSEQYLSSRRDAAISLLELGVKSGASLRMWKEYFPRGDIHGVDLRPDCREHEEDRIQVHIASQDDRPALEAIAEAAGGFDLVLDDCSHINVLTLASFEILFPHVRPGGFYIIEDLGMSWIDDAEVETPDTFMDGELGMNMARGVPARQERSTLTARFEQLLFDMDMLRGDVRFVHFWPNIVIVQKHPDDAASPTGAVPTSP